MAITIESTQVKSSDWQREQQSADLFITQLSKSRRFHSIKGNEPGQEIAELERDNIHAAIAENHEYDSQNN